MYGTISRNVTYKIGERTVYIKVFDDNKNLIRSQLFIAKVKGWLWNRRVVIEPSQLSKSLREDGRPNDNLKQQGS